MPALHGRSMARFTPVYPYSSRPAKTSEYKNAALIRDGFGKVAGSEDMLVTKAYPVTLDALISETDSPLRLVDPWVKAHFKGDIAL